MASAGKCQAILLWSYLRRWHVNLAGDCTTDRAIAWITYTNQGPSSLLLPWMRQSHDFVQNLLDFHDKTLGLLALWYKLLGPVPHLEHQF